MQIQNDDQLMGILLVQMSEIINVVADQLVDELKDIIKRVVYNPFKPAIGGYQRQGENGGFLGSWEDTSKASIYGNTITSTIESNPSLMNINREEFIHGSVLRGGEYHSDIRDFLAEMINEAGDKVGNVFGDTDPPAWWKSPRPYWDEFIKLLENGRIEFLIEKEFRSRGIKYIKL